MAQITWSGTTAASFRSATFLSLSQSSPICVATLHVAGMNGNWKPSDFAPKRGRPPVPLSQASEQKEVPGNLGLAFSLLWTSWGASHKLCSLSEPQFCHLSPTYNKCFLAPRELFDLLMGKYLCRRTCLLLIPPSSLSLPFFVSHGWDLLFIVAP